MVVAVGLLALAGLAVATVPGVGGALGPYAGSPVVAASLGLGALLTAAVGTRVRQPVLARWLAAAAVGTVAYQLALVLADATGWDLLVGLAHVGHVPTLTLAALAPLVVREVLRPGAGLLLPRVVAGLAALTLGLQLIAVAGIGGVGVARTTGVVTLVWLAGLAAPAVRLALDHRREHTSPLRERLAVLTVAAAAPVAQVLVCGLLGLAASTSALGEEAAAVVLVSGIGVMWPLAATALALAVRGLGETSYAVGRGVLARALVLTLASVAVLLGATVGITLAARWPALGALGASLLAAAAALAVQPWVRRIGDSVSGRPAAPAPEAVAAATVHELGVPVERPVDALSAREREVLGLLASGLSNAGIAAELVLSERTVEAHLRSVFTKLRLPDDRGDNRRVLAALAWHQVTATRRDPEASRDAG